MVTYLTNPVTFFTNHLEAIMSRWENVHVDFVTRFMSKLHSVTLLYAA